MTTRQNVVTYQHGYLSGRSINLCGHHADGVHRHPTVERIFGTLGPVSHGSHPGACAACAAEHDIDPYDAETRTEP